MIKYLNVLDRREYRKYSQYDKEDHDAKGPQIIRGVRIKTRSI